ncbi:hypothetical protein MIND_00294300 [Mycena indigotica]|uniref:RTA1-like protein n=1 Tax=Mycena indigotica TaxID=2126181 RepID=A0A8H6T1Q2_9AGAR|nr:uncharacterized protein MIND_00294300 [Mycena indigotica]KAF7309240.1 hypothetical protein MIND_00294300 [Mycena indigotica]
MASLVFALMARQLEELEEPSEAGGLGMNETMGMPPMQPELPYGYIPNEALGIMFIALFGVSTVLHFGQALYFRTWFLLPTAVLCGAGELIGWVARVWSSSEPYADTPFKMQISTTIIAPTPLLAASFIIFSRIVRQLGPEYSLLPARWYAWVFVSCDLVALVVQGVGGGLASAAVTLDEANKGSDIMLGGIGFQFAVVILFTLLVADFLIRRQISRPWRPAAADATPAPTLIPTRTKVMLYGLAFSTLVFIVRSVYRVVELAEGWGGRIIRTEVYFNALDGAMIVLAIFTWNFVHPGWFLPAPAATASDNEKDGHEKAKNSDETRTSVARSSIDVTVAV